MVLLTGFRGRPRGGQGWSFSGLLLMALLVMATLLAGTPVQAGPAQIAGWQFEEGSGTTPQDMTANNLDATILYGATYSTDVMAGGAGGSYSLAFNNGRVNTPTYNPGYIIGNHDWTVSFLMKYTPQGQDQFVAYMGDLSTINGGFYWIIDPSGRGNFGFFNGIVNGVDLFTYANQWVKVTTTYTAATGTVASYLNGSLVAENAGPPASLPHYGLVLGYAFLPGANFLGNLDNVMFYDYVNPPVVELATNLIGNGDFELGNVGFDTQYLYGPTNAGICTYPNQMGAGCYDVNTTPSNTHTSFANFADHTPGAGTKMLVANGNVTPEYVWQQTVEVAPTSNYLFTAYATSALQGDTSPAYLFIQADLTQPCGFGNTFQTIGSINASFNANEWVENRTAVLTGNATQICLQIVNNNTEPLGNDYAIDDLSMIVDTRVPTTVDDAATTVQSNQLFFDILANDTAGSEAIDPMSLDLDPSTPELQTFVWTANGYFSWNGSMLMYQPNFAFFGTESVNYQVSSENGVPSNVSTITVNVTAVYPINVTLSGIGRGTVSSEPVSIACGKFGCNATAAAGTVLTLTANPMAPDVFAGWSGACNGTELTCQVTMDAAKNVIATFDRATYALTVVTIGQGSVTSDLPGISCGSDCTEDYVDRSMVMLTATPESGATFVGWSGVCAGTDICVVAMDAAKSVTATFAVAATQACAPISGIYGTASNSTGSYTITWGPSATPDVTYELYENDGVDPIYSGPARSYTISGKGNGTYSYKVRAIRDTYAPSPLKGTVQVTVTLATACARINSISINKYSNGNYQVRWAASATSGSSYVLYADSGSGWGVAYSGNNRYLNVANQSSGTYRYKVVATNGTLLPSPDSNIAQVTINP